jgi:hypothetical protein
MSYDNWKAREPDTDGDRDHEWKMDETYGECICKRCGRLVTDRDVPLSCLPPPN